MLNVLFCHTLQLQQEQFFIMAPSLLLAGCQPAQWKSLQTADAFQINGSNQQSSTTAAETVERHHTSNQAGRSEEDKASNRC